MNCLPCLWLNNVQLFHCRTLYACYAENDPEENGSCGPPKSWLKSEDSSCQKDGQDI